MSHPRLHITDPLGMARSVILDGDRHHYLTNVMRRKTGDKVALFNGVDGEWLAVVTAQKKNQTTLEVETQTKAQAGVPDLWLLFAPIKRLRVDFLAQKATELGVALLWPVVTQRTVVARIKEERLLANAIEAAEQTGRLSIPTVQHIQPLSKVLEGWDHGRALVFCDEAGDDPNQEWGGQSGRAAPVHAALNEAAQKGVFDKWAVLIGPEGGFTPDERSLVRSCPFVVPVSLGPRIMRADTAAFAVISVWQSLIGDWGEAP